MTSMRENNCEENDLPPAKETKNKTNRTEQIKIKTNRREPWEEPPLDKQDRLASPVPPFWPSPVKRNLGGRLDSKNANLRLGTELMMAHAHRQD